MALLHVQPERPLAIRAVDVRPEAHPCPVLVLMTTEEEVAALAWALPEPLRTDFAGQDGQLLLAYRVPPFAAERVLFVGLGPAAKVEARSFRCATAAAVQELKARRLVSVACAFPATVDVGLEVAGLLASCFLLADYAFDQFITDEARRVHLRSVDLLTATPQAALCEPISLANSTCLTRDLMNTRADLATPETMAAYAVDLCRQFPNVHVHVVDHHEIVEKGMNLIHAVGQGASQPPRIVCLFYEGDPASPRRLGLVGKGLCFDTGGLNLKVTGAIEDMHTDKGGACAVLGTIHALATLRLEANVVGVLPLAENAVGPDSCKPHEILKSYKGLTVLNVNTDFEGRLVLADAMTYCQRRYQVDQLFTLATLTGAMVTALGDYAAGMFTASDALAAALAEAGRPGDERVWRMPVYREYTEELRTAECDLKSGTLNPGKAGGACTAAAFLGRFVEEGVEYVHLDIASSAGFTFHGGDVRPWIPRGSTGWGPNILVHYIKKHRCSA